MTTTNQAEKFCSLNLMLFPALLICICRLKLLGIECLRPFWALGIRKRCGGATFPVGAPLFHRRSLLLVLSTWDKRCGGATLLRWSAARQSCHSCFSACAVLRQQCASLLLTSFKAVCSWPASKCELCLLAALVSSWWVITDKNLGEAVNSFRLQSLWTGTFHHGPKAQGTPLMIVVELELWHYCELPENIVIQGTTG